jgi:hypothetical protein
MLFSFLENLILYVEEMICYITCKLRHPLRDIDDHSTELSSYDISNINPKYANEIDLENR